MNIGYEMEIQIKPFIVTVNVVRDGGKSVRYFESVQSVSFIELWRFKYFEATFIRCRQIRVDY